MHAIWYWLHVGCAGASVAGFLLRGVWMLRDSPLRRRRLVRVLPHLVDTVLLVAAGGLAMSLGRYPFVDAWLTSKVLALAVWIGLGLVAFRFGRTRRVRALAFVGALLAVAWILAVAFTRRPIPVAW